MNTTLKYLKLYYLYKFGIITEMQIYILSDIDHPSKDTPYVQKMKEMTDEFHEFVKNHPHPEQIIIVPQYPRDIL